ncbi:MAG: hypothetical protein ACTHW7_03110 [Actinomycetaceae bacterium]
MEPNSVSPVRWAESVSASEFTGLSEIEDRVLAAGIPGGPERRGRGLGIGGVILVIVLLLVPIAGLVAFIESATFVQDGVVRIFGIDLDTDVRLWMGAVCFSVAALEALVLLAWGLRGRDRGRESFPMGLPVGIGILAVLALWQIVQRRHVYLPDGFDARIAPIVVALVLAIAAGAVGMLVAGRAVTPPEEPVGPPVSRAAISALSPGEMTALLDSRAYLLQVLRRRGIVDHNVEVAALDRRPLGSWE